MIVPVYCQITRAIPTTPWEMVTNSSPVTQTVLGLLAVLSLISWGVIFRTWGQLSSASSRALKFAQEFDRTRKLDEANSLARRTHKNAFSTLFLRAAHFITDIRAGSLRWVTTRQRITSCRWRAT